ncbi:DUF5677 domain-containing protein [Haloimpatiens massiliensis]|uniref:DUF5677 domain-containing protein n=1 Tax=Haloimpatiens massiliensis TaxID=1658110 RepID=UPI000C84EF5E|nr:DUF5677 domain-containing protein [Haloimpatiens massiliensis]
MGYIEKIQGSMWDKFIDDNISFLEEILDYGQYIIELVNEEQKNKKSDGKAVENFHDSVIILLLGECLQVLDGILSLFKGQSIDMSMNLIRSLLELTMYIVYILKDNSMTTKRAIAYDISNINNKIKNYEMLYSKTGEEKYKGAKDNLLIIFDKYNIYKEVNCEWEKKEKKLNSRINKKGAKIQIKWYSVHGGGKGFSSLCRYVKLEPVYSVYSYASNIIHGGNAMEGIYVNQNKEIFIKNPKIPFFAYEILECVYQLTSVLYVGIIKYFLPVEDMKNFTEWDKEIVKKKELLQKNWSGFRDECIKSGKLY